MSTETIAAQAIEAAASAEQRAENAEAVTEAVVAAAEERVEEAQETAERIAEAAILSEQGRRIDEHERRVSAWQADLENRLAQLAALPELVATLQAQVLALSETLAAMIQPASSSPAPSPIQTPLQEEIAGAAAVILPGAAPSAEAVNPAPAMPRKKVRLI
jgi:hypothetical protein